MYLGRCILCIQPLPLYRMKMAYRLQHCIQYCVVISLESSKSMSFTTCMLTWLGFSLLSQIEVSYQKHWLKLMTSSIVREYSVALALHISYTLSMEVRFNLPLWVNRKNLWNNSSCYQSKDLISGETKLVQMYSGADFVFVVRHLCYCKS